MIDSYGFGRMVVDGKNYGSDLIIHPDGRVIDNWWRREGHRLGLGDIAGLIDSSPEVIVVGTGAAGLMRVDRELVEELAGAGIRLIAMRTGKAVKEFNELAGRSRVAGCFHLTC